MERVCLAESVNLSLGVGELPVRVTNMLVVCLCLCVWVGGGDGDTNLNSVF